MFVRDGVGSANCLAAGLRVHLRAKVISEHMSKSVHLPVYQFERPDLGLRFTLRNNFYNWKLSVESEVPLTTDFSCLFPTRMPKDPEYQGNALADCYFEGFPKDRIFGYYESNPRKFSAEIWDNYSLMTVLYLIMKEKGALRPMYGHTPEEHQAQMEVDSMAWDKYHKEEARIEAEHAAKKGMDLNEKP